MSQISWHVWRSEPQDFNVLTALEEDAFKEQRWGKNSLIESYDARGVTVLFGGRSKKVPEGFIIIRCTTHEAEILSFGVLTETRGTGLGRKLLDTVIGEVKKKGIDTMFLEVRTDNDAALALYTSSGFAETGRRTRYYADGCDALIMAKTLIAF